MVAEAFGGQIHLLRRLPEGVHHPMALKAVGMAGLVVAGDAGDGHEVHQPADDFLPVGLIPPGYARSDYIIQWKPSLKITAGDCRRRGTGGTTPGA